jgi:N-ethylmaleimide reductase
MLFDKFSARSLHLTDHMVMAPMTRSRATPEHTPDALMATYYGQRATAGLIITEGTSPSPNGLGYARIPRLYNAVQVNAWKATTAAVHAQGGKIFVQFMHCGRVAHVANLPLGAEVVGPGTAVCPGEMYTDKLGMQPHSPPRAMLDTDLAQTVKEHVTAAKLALDAGFDGVELHGANGYLIEQFLNPLVNLRTMDTAAASKPATARRSRSLEPPPEIPTGELLVLQASKPRRDSSPGRTATTADSSLG